MPRRSPRRAASPAPAAASARPTCRWCWNRRRRKRSPRRGCSRRGRRAERASFALPPSRLAVEPADVVSILDADEPRLYRVTDVGEHGVRDIEARAVDPEVYGLVTGRERPVRTGAPVITGQPLVEFIDLPLLRGDEPPAAGYVAARQTPWARKHRRLRLAGDHRLCAEGAGDGARYGRRNARRPAGARLWPPRSRHAAARAHRRRAAQLRHPAAAARRQQRRRGAQRRWRVGGAAVPECGARLRRHLRAVGAAARPGGEPSSPCAPPCRPGRASC